MNAVRSLLAEYLQDGNKVALIEPQKHENPVEKSLIEIIQKKN